ncbi:hypothetical protein PUR26_25650 [Streptomyces sp. SP18CS02]|nr:hypothetical protein [Streptomyces sp. SP18CS02]
MSPLAVAYHDAGRPREARRELDRAIEADPSAGWAYLQRAWMNRTAGRLSAALADADRCVELGHGVTWASRERALIHLYRGRPDEALAELGTYAQDGEDDRAAALQLRSRAHRQAGRLDQALRDAERLVSFDRESGVFPLAMAVSRAAGGSAPEAVERWREVERLAKDPEDRLVAACALGDLRAADARLRDLLDGRPTWDQLAFAEDALAELLRCPGADPHRLEPLLHRVRGARGSRT